MSEPFTLRVREPVILRGGRDSLVAPSAGAMGAGVHRNGPGHVIGRKPPRFCRWLFEVLGAHAGDEFHDLFPGSGAVQREWEKFNAQPVLDAVSKLTPTESEAA